MSWSERGTRGHARDSKALAGIGKSAYLGGGEYRSCLMRQFLARYGIRIAYSLLLIGRYTVLILALLNIVTPDA